MEEAGKPHPPLAHLLERDLVGGDARRGRDFIQGTLAVADDQLECFGMTGMGIGRFASWSEPVMAGKVRRRLRQAGDLLLRVA